MPNISASDLNKGLQAGKIKSPIILLYGQNEELQADLFKVLLKYFQVQIDDPFRFVRLESDVIDADPGRLADELGAISMFGGKRVIHARVSARQTPLVIRQALTAPVGDWALIIATGDLDDADWKSELTAQAEVLAVACAEERAGDFHAFVLLEFSRAGLTCEEAAAELLISLLGEDRSAVRGEIEKFLALLGPNGVVKLDNVRDVVADASSMLADEIARASFSGDCNGLARLLDRLKATGSDPIQALGAALRQALGLHRSKARQWSDRNASGAPNWSAAEVRSLVKSLAGAVAQVRSDSANADVLAERALLALAQASRLRRR